MSMHVRQKLGTALSPRRSRADGSTRCTNVRDGLPCVHYGVADRTLIPDKAGRPLSPLSFQSAQVSVLDPQSGQLEPMVVSGRLLKRCPSCAQSYDNIWKPRKRPNFFASAGCMVFRLRWLLDTWAAQHFLEVI